MLVQNRRSGSGTTMLMCGQLVAVCSGWLVSKGRGAMRSRLLKELAYSSHASGRCGFHLFSEGRCRLGFHGLDIFDLLGELRLASEAQGRTQSSQPPRVRRQLSGSSPVFVVLEGVSNPLPCRQLLPPLV